jgi:hypothetical protein
MCGRDAARPAHPWPCGTVRTSPCKHGQHAEGMRPGTGQKDFGRTGRRPMPDIAWCLCTSALCRQDQRRNILRLYGAVVTDGESAAKHWRLYASARGGQKQRRKILLLYGGVATDGAITGERCHTGEGEDGHGLAEIGQLG